MATIELNGQQLNRRFGPNHCSRVSRFSTDAKIIHWIVPHHSGVLVQDNRLSVVNPSS